MRLVVEKADPDELYELVLSLVVPRPVGWLSTVSADGVPNLAPFSFFNAVCDAPPVFVVSVSRRDDGTLKDTVKNLLKTREAVINVASEELLPALEKTGEEVGPEVDEFELAGLTKEPARLVKVPRVKEAKAFFECRFVKRESVYDYELLFLEAVLVEVRDEVIRDGSVDYEKLKPVGRLGGPFYARAYGPCKIQVK
ncbi:MAG: flavin reductase family protein [Aquificae bacterium]|nr:flavin reductase family protein [Aquificota bacterium]